MVESVSARKHPQSLSYLNGVLLVLLAGILWSTIGLGIRSIEQANVWQILMYRSFSLSTFLFILITLRPGFSPLQTIRRVGMAGVVGGLGLVVAFTGGIYAIQTTSVANAMFLFASAPFITAVLGWIILRESIRRATWIASAFACLGIGVMVFDGFSMGQMSGNISALFSALGFAIFAIALRWGKLEDMLPAVFLGGVFAFAVGILFCSLRGDAFVISLQDASIAISMGVFQVGAGLAVFTIGSKVVPAVELTLLSMTEVVLGPLWVWYFLGETVSINTLLGGGILMLAITGNALSGLRRKPVPVL